jgi:hypothetical protein
MLNPFVSSDPSIFFFIEMVLGFPEFKNVVLIIFMTSIHNICSTKFL